MESCSAIAGAESRALRVIILIVGHYYNDSPWYGDTRVILRKGRLHLDGAAPLLPRDNGTFGIGGLEGPDWVGFESVVDGRAMVLSYSGIKFRRTFTP